MKRTGQKGFTLLELIVVTAIIGVLAAIAIPQYASYKRNAERASMLSDARSLYRAFVIYYLEYQEYPLATSGLEEHIFDKETFEPLTDASLMAGLPFDIDIEQFRDKLDGRKAEEFESPDDMGDNQEFYVILPWAKDPNIKFVVAASDGEDPDNDGISNGVLYADGTVVDGGNWIDGVYITEGGTIIGP